MMGIRKKITVGFVSLAVLLFFSGVVSLSELRALSSETEDLFESASKSVGYGRDMLDALQQQAIVFLEEGYAAGGHITPSKATHTHQYADSIYRNSRTRFDAALQKASQTNIDKEDLQIIRTVLVDYYRVADAFFIGNPNDRIEELEDYQHAYFALTASIKDYMTSSQDKISDRISHLGETAYRAITPGILALGVGIVILLIFLYLIDIYFARPVTKINRSLRNYLASRVPFQVKMEGRGEVFQLKEGIDDLIALNKKKLD